MRKAAVCIYAKTGTDRDHLRDKRAADQRLCFRYINSVLTALHKSEISSLLSSYVTLEPGLCRTSSESPKTAFLMTRLISIWRCSVEKTAIPGVLQLL